MNPVFLDTVGMVANWDDTDQWHANASEVYRRLLGEGRPLMTTDLILCECANAAARRSYRGDVKELREFPIQEDLLIEPTAAEIESAWAAYDRGDAGRAGVIDQVSFQVMRRLGITEAFTNDRHFTAAGFVTLF